MAIRKGHLHILEWILETLHLDGLLDVKLCTLAASEGRLEALQYLRSVGCPWTDDTCWCAIRKGHLNVLKWAYDEYCPLTSEIDKSCAWDVDDRLPHRSRTSLHLAVEHERAEIMKFLIARHAEIDGVDSEGRSPLYYAARMGKVACVEVLIRAGANVNSVDYNNITPLGIATRMNHARVIEILRASGAVA